MQQYTHLARAPGEFVEVGTVRPDPRGRLTLAKPKGSTAKVSKVDAYKQLINEDGSILLIPVVEIPVRELWIHQNPEAMASLRRGIEQAERGEGRKLDLSELPDD